MPVTQVTEAFSVEKGSGLLDLTVISTEPQGSDPRVVNQFADTSFLVFTETTEQDEGQAPSPSEKVAIIKTGPDSYYPLTKGITMVYKLKHNLYLFPPSASGPAHEYLVIVLKTDLKYVIKQFEDILAFFATLVQQVPGKVPAVDAIVAYLALESQPLYPRLPADIGCQPLPPPVSREDNTLTGEAEASRTASALAKGIVTGAEYIAFGIDAGTKVAANCVHEGGHYMVGKQPQTKEPTPIDPKVISGLRYARIGAEGAASVTGACVGVIAAGTRALGEKLAPHIQSQGTRLYSSVTGGTEETSKRTVNDIMTVAASGFQGFATLYNGIAENAKTLAKAVGNETVNYVSKRYGNDAGEATHEALYAAGHMTVAGTNFAEIGPKAMAKRAVKETGKSVFKNSSDKGQVKANGATEGQPMEEEERKPTSG